MPLLQQERPNFFMAHGKIALPLAVGRILPHQTLADPQAGLMGPKGPIPISLRPQQVSDFFLAHGNIPLPLAVRRIS
ncbi:MAG: hypothetical protein ACK5GZ_05175, partial [Cyanobium sp.]